VGDSQAPRQAGRDIAKGSAPFLNSDIFLQFGRIESHIGLMQSAGMTRVSRAWDEDRTAIIVGHGKQAW
jgi:hypothetical protein